MIFNVLLGPAPAHFYTCRGSGERDISGKSSDGECPLHEFLAVLLNEFCCFYSNEQVCENIPTWISLCLTTVFSQQGGISFFFIPQEVFGALLGKDLTFLNFIRFIDIVTI
jgi:hypothetical protein